MSLSGVLRLLGDIFWQGVVDVPAVDMQGQTVLVTGCTVGGMGLETAKKLAEFGARVLVTCRTSEKGDAAAEAVRASVGASASVDVLLVDTSDLDSVRSFVDEVREKLGSARLDVLVANAGVYSYENRQSKQGVEYCFATAALGHFLMIRSLMPKRVVWLTGDIYFRCGGPPDPDFRCTPELGFGDSAYARSCLARLLLGKELRRRYSASEVSDDEAMQVVCVHPGGVATNIFEASATLQAIARLFMLNAEQGGRSAAYLASCPAADISDDTHYYHNKYGWYQLAGNDLAMDDVAARSLYEKCEGLCGL